MKYQSFVCMNFQLKDRNLSDSIKKCFHLCFRNERKSLEFGRMGEQWQNCHFWVNCPFKYWQRWLFSVTSKDYNDVGTKGLSPKTLNTPSMSLKDNMGYMLHYLFMIWYIVLITLKISYLFMRSKGESVILFSVVFLFTPCPVFKSE